MVRIHDAYDSLLDKYSRVLSDEIESRDAVEVVMRNMELLQVAIGKIHAKVIDVKEKAQMNDAITAFMTHISTGIKDLQSKWPNLRVDVQAELTDKVEGEILWSLTMVRD